VTKHHFVVNSVNDDFLILLMQPVNINRVTHAASDKWIKLKQNDQILFPSLEQQMP
jgi:hypothetical protein